MDKATSQPQATSSSARDRTAIIGPMSNPTSPSECAISLTSWRQHWPRLKGLQRTPAHFATHEPLKSACSPEKALAVQAQLDEKPWSLVTEHLDDITAYLRAHWEAGTATPVLDILDNPASLVRRALDDMSRCLSKAETERGCFLGDAREWRAHVDLLATAACIGESLHCFLAAQRNTNEDYPSGNLEDYDQVVSVQEAVHATLGEMYSMFASDLAVVHDMEAGQPSEADARMAFYGYATTSITQPPRSMTDLLHFAKVHNWPEAQRRRTAIEATTLRTHYFHKYADVDEEDDETQTRADLDLLGDSGVFTGFHPRNPLFHAQWASENNVREQLEQWAYLDEEENHLATFLESQLLSDHTRSSLRASCHKLDKAIRMMVHASTVQGGIIGPTPWESQAWQLSQCACEANDALQEVVLDPSLESDVKSSVCSYMQSRIAQAKRSTYAAHAISVGKRLGAVSNSAVQEWFSLWSERTVVSNEPFQVQQQYWEDIMARTDADFCDPSVGDDEAPPPGDTKSRHAKATGLGGSSHDQRPANSLNMSREGSAAFGVV